MDDKTGIAVTITNSVGALYASAAAYVRKPDRRIVGRRPNQATSENEAQDTSRARSTSPMLTGLNGGGRDGRLPRTEPLKDGEVAIHKRPTKMNAKELQQVPYSVNYFSTRYCNAACGFCFHTQLTSFVQRPQKAKEGLRLLHEAGMTKINFAGGEPMTNDRWLGKMLDYCKKELKLESVSIVTNGSLVTREFLVKHHGSIDIIAVSCDSFNQETNVKIGRGLWDNVDQLFRIRDWCEELGIKFKLNTVVCSLNHDEDMNKFIEELRPFRWKAFQCLIIPGENGGEYNNVRTIRDARQYQISDEQYSAFVERHQKYVDRKILIPENNAVMAESYLLLDEYMRFLQPRDKKPSKSILEVGVRRALRQIEWSPQAFLDRDGIYDWQGYFASEGKTKIDI